MINIGVIGCGHWGPNHIRVFSSFNNARIIGISDLEESRLRYFSEQYPGIETYHDYQSITQHPDIEAVVVSTPTETHYQIVKHALESGKHVLCEKPLCQTPEEGRELVKLAEARHLVLMVGHIFLYNAGILKLKELLQSEDMGRLVYLSATRTNLGPVRHDVNAVYDLATHDISIYNFLLDSIPYEASAVGIDFLQPSLHDVAFISLKYPGGVMANIRVSWLDPKKIRHITVVGDQKMATWDDLAEMGPVILYDKGIVKEPYYSNYGEFQLLAREGDVTIPKVKLQEPLRTQDNHFIRCIEEGEPLISDGVFGLDIVKILLAINQSITSGGQPIAIK